MAIPQILDLRHIVDAPSDVHDRSSAVALIYGQGRVGFARDTGEAGAFAIDPLRSAVRTPATAELVAASVYDPFGVPQAEPGDDDPQASELLGTFGFRGELLTSVGVHLRARDYDPATAAFLTRDPLQGLPGTITVANPYHYAANDPINRLDPLGLSPVDDDWFGIGLTLRDLGVSPEAAQRIDFGFLEVASALAFILAESFWDLNTADAIADFFEDLFEDGLGRIPGGIGGRLGRIGDPLEDLLRNNAGRISKIAKAGGTALAAVDLLFIFEEHHSAGRGVLAAGLLSFMEVGASVGAAALTFAVCTAVTAGVGTLGCAALGAAVGYATGEGTRAVIDWVTGDTQRRELEEAMAVGAMITDIHSALVAEVVAIGRRSRGY